MGVVDAKLGGDGVAVSSEVVRIEGPVDRPIDDKNVYNDDIHHDLDMPALM